MQKKFNGITLTSRFWFNCIRQMATHIRDQRTCHLLAASYCIVIRHLNADFIFVSFISTDFYTLK